MQFIKNRLTCLPDRFVAFTHEKIFEKLFNTQMLSSAVLTGGASATVTTGAAYNAIVNGVLSSKATGLTLAVLNGPTIQNTGLTCQAWIFTQDAVGNFYTLPGVPAATIAGIQLPTVYENANGIGQSGLLQVAVGMLTINNASAGAFIPNTTLLNVAGLNPILNNNVGPFYPLQIL